MYNTWILISITCPFSNTQVPKTKPTGADHPIIVSLMQVMSMNRLSLESLLGRFFDTNLLSVYCTARLGQSGKGNASVLASRICRAWSKPAFQPKPLASSGGDSASAAQPKKLKRPASTSANNAAAGGSPLCRRGYINV